MLVFPGMKQILYFFLYSCCFLRLYSDEQAVVIIAHDPSKYIQQYAGESTDIPLFVAVPTNKIARSVRKTCGFVKNLALFSIPISSHSKRFTLYALSKDKTKISLLPEEGTHPFAIKECLSLDEFCSKAQVPADAKLIVDWGDSGYYIVRYANLKKFQDVAVYGLSSLYQKRLNWYLENCKRDI